MRDYSEFTGGKPAIIFEARLVDILPPAPTRHAWLYWLLRWAFKQLVTLCRCSPVMATIECEGAIPGLGIPAASKTLRMGETMTTALVGVDLVVQPAAVAEASGSFQKSMSLMRGRN